MNLMNVFQGKVTYSGCYALIAAGIYSMVHTATGMTMAETREIIAAVLNSNGFDMFMLGWIGWGLRRAMEKGGAKLPPPTEEEKAAEAEALRQTLVQLEQKLQSLKGSTS